MVGWVWISGCLSVKEIVGKKIQQLKGKGKGTKGKGKKGKGKGKVNYYEDQWGQEDWGYQYVRRRAGGPIRSMMRGGTSSPYPPWCARSRFWFQFNCLLNRMTRTGEKCVRKK